MTGAIRIRCQTCHSGHDAARADRDLCRSGTPGCGRSLPAGFYNKPALRGALAKYDFGPVFRAVRAETGVSQEILATLLGQTQPQVSRIERGDRNIRDVALVAHIAKGLGIPGPLLGFGPDHSASAAAEQDEDWMRRRTFVSGITAIMSLGVTGISDPCRGKASIQPGASRIGLSEVEAVEKATKQFRDWDNARPKALWLSLTEAELKHVATWTSATCSDEVRARAQLATADLAGLVAWMHYDRGKSGAARRRWAEALESARAAAHPRGPDLSATVLLNIAHHELHIGNPREALWMTNLADGLIDTSRYPVTTTTRAYIATTQAWCHATLGDIPACLRALGTAQQQYADADLRTAPPWAAPGGPAEVAAQVGHALFLLSATDQTYAEPAITHLTTAIGGYGDPYARSRTVNLPGLACSLFRVGDIDMAVTMGLEAVAAAQALGVPRTVARLKRLAAVAEPHASRSDVRDLRHQIDKAEQALV